MQAPNNLPIVASQGASAAGAPAKGGSGGDDASGAQFSQALSREMGQRQSHPAPAPAQAPAGRNNKAEPASGRAHVSSADAEATEALAQETPSGAIAVADLSAITPVTDMLALAAALNPPKSATAVAANTPQPEAQAGIPGAEAGPAAAVAVAVAPPVDAATAALATAAPSVVPGTDLSPAADAPAVQAAATAVTDAATALRPQPGMAAPESPVAAPAQPGVRHDARPAPQGGFAALAAQAGQLRSAATDAAPTTPGAEKPADVSPAALLATASQQPLAAARTEAATAAVRDHLPARVGSQGWDQQLGNRIVLMAGANEQVASLTLNPPDLGPMQIVLAVTDDKASVAFTSAQPEVRIALEAAMPRLRDMLGESGIALGDATVSAGDPGDRPHDESPRGRHGSGATLASDAPAARQPARPAGLVDTFA